MNKLHRIMDAPSAAHRHLLLGAMLFVVTAGAVRAATDEAWRARMDAMSALLSELVADLANEPGAAGANAAADTARKERVRTHAATLANLTHSMAPSQGETAWPDADPSIPWLALQLREGTAELRRADLQTDDGRDTLLNVITTCVDCHTRGTLGVQQPALALPAPPVSMPAWARADVLVATRRFEDASRAYQQALSDAAWAKTDPRRYHRTARRALALELRARADTSAALAVVDRVEKVRGPTATTGAWRRTLRNKSATAATTPTAQLALAQRLLDEAATVQSFKRDDSADALMLLASAALHRVVADAKASATERADAFEKLGVTSEQLHDLDGGLALPFYAACIQAAPRSALGKSCYGRYERFLDVNWRGSSGAPLPVDIEAEKQRLRQLAAPEPEAPKKP